MKKSSLILCHRHHLRRAAPLPGALLALAVALSAAPRSAQAQPVLTPPPLPAGPEGPPVVMVQRWSAGVAGPGPSAPVSDKPFRLSATTRTTQHLPDGNELVNSTQQELARDSRGRSWQRTLPGSAGPGSPGESVFVRDPVGQMALLIFPAEKQAWSVPFSAPPPPNVTLAVRPAPGGELVTRFGGAPGVAMMVRPPMLRGGPAVAGAAGPVGAEALAAAPPWTMQSLGEKIILGLRAAGRRMVSIIPSGAMGNKKPLRTEIEHWVSVDLDIPLHVTQNDPLMGTTEYVVTDISTQEPDAALFQVPAGYRMNEATGPGPVLIERGHIEKNTR